MKLQHVLRSPGALLIKITNCTQTIYYKTYEYRKQIILLLVTARAPTSTSPFEFPSLSSHEWLSVRMWHSRSQSKVFDSFASVASALQENSFVASRAPQRQLVKSNDFSS
jgi:hypothetical protein